MTMHTKTLLDEWHTFNEAVARTVSRELVLLLSRRCDIVWIAPLTIRRAEDDESFEVRKVTSGPWTPVERARLLRMADFYARAQITPEKEVLKAIDALRPPADDDLIL